MPLSWPGDNQVWHRTNFPCFLNLLLDVCGLVSVSASPHPVYTSIPDTSMRSAPPLKPVAVMLNVVLNFQFFTSILVTRL